MDTYKNFAISTVTVAPTPKLSGLFLTVLDGSVYPAAPFNATVWPFNMQPLRETAEIVRVIANVGNVLTLLRSQESSTPREISVGDKIAATITVKTLTDIEALVSGEAATRLVEKAAHLAAADPHTGYRLESVAIVAADVAADIATQAELDVLASVYAPQIPALVAAHDPRLCRAAGPTDANIMLGARVIVPRSGILTDFYIWPTVSVGNVDGAIYSTAGTRILLWSSGSVACPAINGWRSLGNPALAVTAGDQLEFAVANTAATAAFIHTADSPVVGLGSLPAGFWPANGALPKVSWYHYAFPAPASLAEGVITGYAYGTYVMARIV